MNYYERVWIKKKQKIFNYGEIIKNILQCKNLFINKKGLDNTENILISKLKSLNKLYFTNNICQCIHSKIANHLPNFSVSKKNFIDTIEYILKNYSIHFSDCPRRDYISRTLIIIIEKYNLNDKPMYINYKLFQKELQYTISFMTGYIQLNSINEQINSIIQLQNIDNYDKNNEESEKTLSSENDSDYNEEIQENENDNIINNIINENKTLYTNINDITFELNYKENDLLTF